MKNQLGKLFFYFYPISWKSLALSNIKVFYYRIQMLEAELASRKEVDYEETAHLEKAVEKVEDNLKRSTVNTNLNDLQFRLYSIISRRWMKCYWFIFYVSQRRALSAENTVTSLKKEIKALTVSINFKCTRYTKMISIKL